MAYTCIYFAHCVYTSEIPCGCADHVGRTMINNVSAPYCIPYAVNGHMKMYVVTRYLVDTI